MASAVRRACSSLSGLCQASPAEAHPQKLCSLAGLANTAGPGKFPVWKGVVQIPEGRQVAETLTVFEERPKAIEAAVMVAQASARRGRVSGVVVEEDNGNLIPIWDAGRDAYSTLS